MRIPCRHFAALVAAALLGGALAGCATDRLQSEPLALFEQQRYEEALALLEQSAKDSPRHGKMQADLLAHRDRAVIRLVEAGRSELNAGRIPEARKLFERVLAIHPSSTQGRDGLAAVETARRQEEGVEQARARLTAGDVEGARSALDAVLLENREHREAKALRRQVDERDARASS